MAVSRAVGLTDGVPRDALQRPPRMRVVDTGVTVAVALAAASLATQAYWIATGDAFALGLVPAFNPAGVGNLATFARSAALAAAATWIGVLAAAQYVHGRRGWMASGLLAAAAALLSLQQLALPRPRLGGDPAWLAVGYEVPPGPTPRDTVIAVAAVVLAGIVAWAWRTADAARGRLAAGALLFAAGLALDAVAGAATMADWSDPRVAAALVATAANAFAIVGVALIAHAVTSQLQTVLGARPAPLAERGADTASLVRLTVDDGAPNAIGVASRPGGLDLQVRWRPLARWLFAVIAGLVVASLLATWAHGRWPALHRAYRLFYVDFEGNVPTWWSAMLLLASGAVAAIAALDARRAGDRRWIDWLTLGAVLLAMSADEAASLHELMQKPVRALLGAEAWLRYPLVVPGLLIGAVLAVRFRAFLATLGVTRRRLAIAAAIFAAGALGFETMGGWFAPEAIGPNGTYLALTTIEEALEMTGSTLVLLALLRHRSGGNRIG